MKFKNDNISEMKYELVDNVEDMKYACIIEKGGMYFPFIKNIDLENTGIDIEDFVLHMKDGNGEVYDPGFYNVYDRDNMVEAYIDSPELVSTNWEMCIDDDSITDLTKSIIDTDISSAAQAPFISSCGSNIFVPTFFNDDNVLNKAMKTALLYKGINLDSYRGSFDNTSDFNNNRRHLVDKKYTTLSMSKFEKMCNIFDLDYTVTLSDKGDSKHPMSREISFSSNGDCSGNEDMEYYLKYINGELNDDEEDEDEEEC